MAGQYYTGKVQGPSSGQIFVFVTEGSQTPLHIHAANITFCSSSLLLSPSLLHGQYLYHPHENVDEIKLQRNGFVDSILPESSLLRHSRMRQNLLRVVKREPAKHCKSSIQPQVLSPHQRSRGSSGQHQRRQARKCHNRYASKEGTTDVQVLLLLRRGADKGNGTHHSNGIEAGAS